jgi:hypothetical protein
MNWKGLGRKRSSPNRDTRNLLGLRKTAQQDGRCSDRDSNRESPDCKWSHTIAQKYADSAALARCLCLRYRDVMWGLTEF